MSLRHNDIIRIFHHARGRQGLATTPMFLLMSRVPVRPLIMIMMMMVMMMVMIIMMMIMIMVRMSPCASQRLRLSAREHDYRPGRPSRFMV